MITFALLVLAVCAAYNVYAINQIRKDQKKNMANVTERFQAIEAKLDEGAAEIIKELQALRDLGVTPEGEAILQRIEAKANAQADISPPVE